MEIIQLQITQSGTPKTAFFVVPYRLAFGVNLKSYFFTKITQIDLSKILKSKILGRNKFFF